MARKVSTAKQQRATSDATASHFTKAFLKVWEPIEAKILETGEITEDIKISFRDAMLTLGHEERIKNLYRIQGKLTRDAEFFHLNEPQEKYLATKKGRDIILKIRQVGFTTLNCVRSLDKAIWEPNSRMGIMAHTQTVVSTIFDDILKFTYTWFKKDFGHLYAPVEKSDSSTTLAFSTDGLGRELNSSVRVLFDFRGKTVSFLHVSEASRIEPERLLGSLQGVPVNGEVIFESTPNGRGGEFFRQWQNHKVMGELAPYRGHFIPWYEFYPEVPEDWKAGTSLDYTPYERELLELYPDKITPAHIAWRRWCIEANCQGDPEKFDNEYPTNDIDCFFTGENMVFPGSVLKLQDRYATPPKRLGFLLPDNSQIKFHMDSKGVVAIWKDPQVGGEYVIGADVSGGVGKDRSAAIVFHRQTGELVARVWGQFDPVDFGNELYKLALFYNKAWICPEANNHGHAVIYFLTTKHYKNIYKRKVLDSNTNKVSTQLGFLTTSESKLLLTEKFKDACKNVKIKISDGELISEMSTYVQIMSKQGRTVKRQASSGSHDDLVMAAALAWEMHLHRGGTEHFDEQDSSYDESDSSGLHVDSDTGFLS